MEQSVDLLKKLPPFLAWMPQEGLEMFQICFDLEVDVVPAGERRGSGGRLGILLSGELERLSGPLEPGALWGAARREDGSLCREDVSVTAVRDSEVAWLDGAVLTAVCYRACWFHGRFVLEAGRYL